MNYSYLLLFCGLSQLLLFVAANPPNPNPCTDPSNYNLVVPMRRTTSTGTSVALPTDTSLTLVNGCYSLQIFPYGLSVLQTTFSDTKPEANLYFNAFLTNTCTGSTAYFSTGHVYYYQTFLTVSNNVNQASLTGVFFSGYAYISDGSYIGCSISTTPVNFEGHSPAQSTNSGRSVSRTGSQCRVVYQNNGISDIDVSTNSFTLSITLDDSAQIDFLVPSNVTASVGTSNGSTTFHQCTCSGF